MRADRVSVPLLVISVLVMAAVAGVVHLGGEPCAGADATQSATQPKTVAPLDLDKPLVAHWKFDETFAEGCLDASGNGHHAKLRSRHPQNADRVPGLFGTALRLDDRHRLAVEEGPDFSKIERIALAAWVMPREFEKYNEIFRKDDDSNRVLFSFQEEGSILSLGLNVGGYVECDAPIDPQAVLDGQWHHCVATFDGEMMRVYLDGQEIHSIERSGKIVAGGLADGCIGSSNGNECFQGLMDDLRIYAEALTADEIAQLYRNGAEAHTRLAENYPADEPEVNKPLVAHWSFNELGAVPVIHDVSGEPVLRATANRAVGRTRGIHGNALVLSGEHGVAIEGYTRPEQLAGIGLSAWVKPSDLRSFREIFRQEGPSRILFSFQENGGVLAFGLNVDGEYEEFDANINPAQVLDGGWHHCAATFDGKHMRVFLDGKQVGKLDKSGAIAAQPGSVTAFIGSSGGSGEFYQGQMDDLRIYHAALSPEEVEHLYQSGIDALQRFTQELEKTVDAFYPEATTFAETLAGCRKNLIDKQIELDPHLAAVLLTRLKADFSEDYSKFAEYTGASVIEYLGATDTSFDVRNTGRLVEMMLEYKPLTESQWKNVTPEDRKKWQEYEQIGQQYEKLVSRGDEVLFSPEWIRIALEAGDRVDFRPSVSEPVAPYHTPSTPETVDLNAEEAAEVLQRDWLHQCSGRPTPERIQQEIDWARQMADKITAASPGTVDYAAELDELAKLENRLLGVTEPDPELYFEVRRVKRGMVFKNPVVDFDKVLFVDMPMPEGREAHHETRHRLGYQAVPGARLLLLEGLSPAGHLKQLMPQAPLHGSFWRPDLSFDAKSVVFCFKPHNQKSFHVYEIGIDGSGLHQITDGPFDDFDPIYLPDGKHVMFSTTRGHTYVRCMPPTNAFVLARCDLQGDDLYLISRNNEPDYLPSVMNDGRVIYTRWEYTDKPLWRAQGLWTVNPDGTQVNTFWGNQSVWPDLLKDARSIPGSRRVMFTGSAHHNWFSGSVGIIDPDKGSNFPHGLTKVTADVTWPESGNGPVDPVESPDYHPSGSYAAYYSPYPLSERDFIVSANRGGRFVLYLMDIDGNRELIYEGAHNIFHALPVRPRPRPPVLPDRVDWPTKEEAESPKPGIIYSGNVYFGAPKELKDKARFLRVLSIDHKTYTYWYKRPYLSTGPVVSIVQSEGVKRVVGTVPIEDDGSVAFHAPPGIPLHFQLLDENHRALQTMRSFTGVMPGERRGCLGCHEMHSKTPQFSLNKSLALVSEPKQITPPPWKPDTVSWERYVRPVLNQYCGKCHMGEGEGRETLDLTPREGFLGFDETYRLFTGRPTWGRQYEMPEDPPPGFGIAGMLMVEGYGRTDPEAYQTPKPMTRLSYKSKLIEIASSGKHHDVKVDPVSLRRLIAWVDTMCPYRGDEEVRAIPDPVFQGVDWLSVRPRIRTAPRIVRPGPIDFEAITNAPIVTEQDE